MFSIQFWKGWAKSDRYLLYIAGFIFIGSLLLLWYSYFLSPAPAITFQTIQEAELTEIPVYTFQKGIFQLSVAGNNYLIFERQLGAPLQTNPLAGYVYLLILTMAVAILLSVITTLSKFYYLVAMGIFILFVVSLRLEVLQLFGQADKTFTIAAIAVYTLVSFYFYYFQPAATFLKRILIFSIISIVVGLLIFFFSESALPFLQVATTGVPAGIILSVIFIVMVSHEIVASFVFIVSQGTKQTKSLNHFLIITVIYFLNLALAYASKFRFIEWNIITINLFLLLTISGILGVWGIRQRQKQFENILDVEPYGVYGFLALGTICFSSLFYFFSTANDPVIEAMSDVIIFSHLGFGLIFLTYVISNFIAMLARNMQVHRVLYNPNNMPFFTFRFGGLIATLAFVFYNAWQVPVHNAFAGFYNAVGDLYMELRNFKLAEVYYDQGRTYGFSNHHSNYALANLQGARMNLREERNSYRSAAARRPTEMAYLNWAQTFQSDQNNLQAILTLQEGLQKFPESGPIQNTLGLLYLRSGLADSALFYLEKASSPKKSFGSGEVNQLGALAKLKTPFSADSISNTSDPSYSYTSNLIACFNSSKQTWNEKTTLPQDTILTRAQAALVNNYLLNQLGDVDTAQLNRVISVARKPGNEGVREAVLFASSLSLYSIGELQQAYRLLEEVTINSSNQGKYNNILTVWTLEQNEPGRALGYIDYALSQNYEPAKLTNAVALSEAGKIKEALQAWDSLRLSQDTTTVNLAERMTNILTIPASQIHTLSDEDKYAFCRYRVQPYDSLTFDKVVSTIQNENAKAKALLERSQRLFDFDRLSSAIKVFQQIRGLQLSDKSLYDEMRHFELMLLAGQKDFAAVKELVKELQFTGHRKKNKHYFDALIAEASNDSTKAAPLFDWLGNSNPFFDEGVVAAADYFRAHGSDPLMAYTILVEGIQNHPGSVKIRKAYCLEAARAGFVDFAASSLQELRLMISTEDFKRFANDNQEVLSGIQ